MTSLWLLDVMLLEIYCGSYPCQTWGEGCGQDSELWPRSGYCAAGAPLPPSRADAPASGPLHHSLLQDTKLQIQPLYEKPKTYKLNYALSLNQPRQNEKAAINLSGIHSQIYIQQWQETIFFYPWLKQIFSVSVMSGCYWAEGLMTAGQNSHLLHPPHFAPKVTMETPPAHLMPWFL